MRSRIAGSTDCAAPATMAEPSAMNAAMNRAPDLNTPASAKRPPDPTPVVAFASQADAPAVAPRALGDVTASLGEGAKVYHLFRGETMRTMHHGLAAIAF